MFWLVEIFELFWWIKNYFVVVCFIFVFLFFYIVNLLFYIFVDNYLVSCFGYGILGGSMVMFMIGIVFVFLSIFLVVLV